MNYTGDTDLKSRNRRVTGIQFPLNCRHNFQYNRLFELLSMNEMSIDARLTTSKRKEKQTAAIMNRFLPLPPDLWPAGILNLGHFLKQKACVQINPE